MGWLVLVLVLLFLYGNLMMVKPSARQKRVALLRAYAIGHGLQVRLASRFKFPEPPSRSDLVCLLGQRADGVEGKSGTAFRNPQSGHIRCYGDFSSHDSEVADIFANLPEGCEVLVADEGYAGVCWSEAGDTSAIDRIASQLSRLQKITEQKEH